MILQKTDMIHIRMTKKEKDFIEKQSLKYNFRSVSDFIRFLVLNEWNINVTRDK